MTSYSNIAHSNLEICSPVSWPVYHKLLLTSTITDYPEIFDIGCGKGGILAKTTALLNGKGTGVDLENSFASDPTLEAKELESEGKLKFIFQDAHLFLKSVSQFFDLIICVGSSHALGGPEQAFSELRKYLNPNGHLLFGELVWKQKPAQEFLRFLKCSENDQMYSSQLLEIAKRNGFFVQQSISGTDEDFEDYESNLRGNINNWQKKNPNDPKASEYLKRSDTWWEAREKWGRQTFGFEILLAKLV